MGNIALNGNMTASNYIAPFTASRAVNGSTAATSRWVGEVTAPSNPPSASLTLTCGSRKFVNRWIVRHMSMITGWTAPKYSMSDYALQGSMDGNAWTTIDSVTNNQSSLTDRTFVSVYYPYYRVNVTKGLNCNNKIASIMEFELYEAPPTSQYLSNLTISSGTLTPAFARNTYAYTASVGYDVTSITVTPTAEVPTYLGQNAIIKVNGVVVASGTASTAIPLNIGTNTITVNVTSAIGGATQNYTLTVTRADSNYLSGLSLMNGTTAIPLNPAFAKATTAYTANVGFDVTSLTVTATKESTNASIKINGTDATSGQAFTVNNLVVGANTITVAVTTPGMPLQNYTVVVTRTGSTYLSAISCTKGPATPPVSKTPPFTYTLKAGITAATTTVTLTAEDTTSTTITLQVDANTYTSTTGTLAVPGVPTASAPGKTVTATVSSSTGVTSTVYTIYVIKANP